ncbi:hypothetical protein BJG92_02941 [Arthrobacter sp. SO5]|nr:hypothetical protein [Arthrobacter sp. SO5]
MTPRSASRTNRSLRSGAALRTSTTDPRPMMTTANAVEPQKPRSSRKTPETNNATENSQNCEETAAFSHLPRGEGLSNSTAMTASYY